MNSLKSILFLPLILVCVQSTIAQEEDFGVIVWDKSVDLEWDDFKGSPLVDSFDNYYIDLHWESSYMYQGDSYLFRGQQPRTYIYTYTSYVDPEIRNDDLLRYINTYFDLASYYAHKLTHRSHIWRKARNSNVSYDAMKDAIVNEWRIEASRLELETQHGIEVEKLVMWEQKIDDLFNELPDLKYIKSKHSVGFELGVGGTKGVNNYSNYLTNSVVGILAIEFTSKPYVFALGISGGGKRVKETFSQGSNEYLFDSEPHILNFFMHGGYQLLNTNRFRFIPRVGLHISNINYPQDDNLNDSNTVFNYTGGATLDIKLWNYTSKMLADESLSDFALRLGGYYYPMQVGSNNISHFIFTAGLSFTIGGGYTSYK